MTACCSEKDSIFKRQPFVVAAPGPLPHARHGTTSCSDSCAGAQRYRCLINRKKRPGRKNHPSGVHKYIIKTRSVFLNIPRKRNISHFANAKYITRRKAYIAFLRSKNISLREAQTANGDPRCRGGKSFCQSTPFRDSDRAVSD